MIFVINLLDKGEVILVWNVIMIYVKNVVKVQSKIEIKIFLKLELEWEYIKHKKNDLIIKIFYYTIFKYIIMFLPVL